MTLVADTEKGPDAAVSTVMVPEDALPSLGTHANTTCATALAGRRRRQLRAIAATPVCQRDDRNLGFVMIALQS